MACGVVCQEPSSTRLHWLAAEHASWIRDVPAGALQANLALTSRLTTRMLPDGSLSIIARPAVSHLARRLELGQSLRVFLGEGQPWLTPDGLWRYVARLEVPPVLLSYDSPDAGLASGSSRLAEVDHLDKSGQPEVTLVELGSRLVTMDLPVWLPETHQSIGDGGGADAGIHRFREYQRWYQGGLAPPTPENPIEGVLRLAGDLASPDAPPDPHTVAQVMRQWLAADGEALFNLVGDAERDAAPLLAAAMGLDAMSQNDPKWGQSAVLSLRQLGRRAAASLHTEQFATAWINRPERHVLKGAWERLRRANPVS